MPRHVSQIVARAVQSSNPNPRKFCRLSTIEKHPGFIRKALGRPPFPSMGVEPRRPTTPKRLPGRPAPHCVPKGSDGMGRPAEWTSRSASDGFLSAKEEIVGSEKLRERMRVYELSSLRLRGLLEWVIVSLKTVHTRIPRSSKSLQ